MNYFFKLLACFAVISIAFTSCTSDDSNEAAGFSVKLVDAPGDYDEVLVDVQGIEAIVDGEAHEFTALEPGVYNLLDLTGGVSAMLVESVIPAGKLSQIRLILGENNAVVSAGDTIALKTPSAQQSGLKLNVHQDMVSGILYEFILDFNVDKSVVETTQGLILKPVIRAALEAESGAIAGVVTPADVSSLVTATDGTVEISAFTAEETGGFLLYGVPAGTYQVIVTPDSTSGMSPVTINEVMVEKGEVMNLEAINLQ